MANVFCSSTGSNTAPYDTWAKAATTFATALGAASTNGDIIAVDATNPPATISASVTWSLAANISVIASTNSGTSTITPTIMGATTALGNYSGATFGITLQGAFRAYFYGITIRQAGSSADNFRINFSDGGHFEFEDCYFWMGTTNASARMIFGSNTGAINHYTLLKRCTLRFGNTGQNAPLSGAVDIIGGSVAAAGSVPTTLFSFTLGPTTVTIAGADLSLITGTLFTANSSTASSTFLSQCKFGAGVTISAAQAITNKSSNKVFVFDCSSDDTHGLFGYYDAFGQIESDTGTFVTAGAAAQSWKITTTSACSFATPFVTPWISLYSAAASAATYKLELLRNNGTATTYSDSEVWGEFSVKDNSGFTNSDVFTDRQALVDWAAGTAGSTSGRTGTGTGNWTIGSSNSPASFIVDSGSAITHAENGHIRARVAVGLASVSNLFLDPQIRT